MDRPKEWALYLKEKKRKEKREETKSCRSGSSATTYVYFKSPQILERVHGSAS
ncbi:hypothetical protein HBHAL_1997 [Halobacillus halophilus DSM 2266]|uniref:Uncharacterized protein n=1 Tax=Halobacillus halophilus (strain ATCC 35676 / DSM 2266 / JCM 20832 / KCTC 3685 / LMG 17431 / NBRC 102448 / NCIMB 2269) TaxID=866895 RepID=I0JJN9_HALH3|nr:hypothetical protein HBHAL_1997 [Halobacillus halophilus DSM 2266]